MKFRITLKDPDGVHHSVVRAIKQLCEEKPDAHTDDLSDEMFNATSKWLRSGEYITVEIDTEAGTCVVLPAK